MSVNFDVLAENYFSRKLYNHNVGDIIPLVTAAALSVRIVIITGNVDHLSLFNEIVPLSFMATTPYIIVHLQNEHYSAATLRLNELSGVCPGPLPSPQLSSTAMKGDDINANHRVDDWHFSAADVASNFTAVSLNIQDLLPKKTRYGAGSHYKIDFLRHICSQEVTPDVICLTETKLCEKIDDYEVNIDNYCLYRIDRNRQGGRVAIYYRDSLDAVALDFSSTPCAAVECAIIKISCHLIAMLFACFYRPPSKKAEWMTQFYDCIDYLQSLNLPLCITGDFNADMLKDSSFVDDIEATYYLRQVIKESTRITKKSLTLLGHIYISHDVAANYHGAFNLHIFNHSATYLQFSGFNKPSKTSSRRVPATMY